MKFKTNYLIKNLAGALMLAILCNMALTAQNAFTAQTVQEIHQEFLTDAVKAYNDRVLPSFTMIGADGKLIDAATFKTWQEGGGLEEWPTSDVTVRTSGTLATATGITKHKPKGAKAAFHQRFTETYEFKDGKWMVSMAQYTDIKS